MAQYQKLLICITLSLYFGSYASAAEVNIAAAKDNTLLESPTGALSNGAGDFLFAGRTGQTEGASIRRTLIAFDIAQAIPSSAIITNASLTLHLSKAVSSATPVSVHRVDLDWGEGTSNASGEEGGGALATTNDATWTKRFFGTESNWTTPGGDYNNTASATASAGAIGPVTWTGPGLLADVTAWYTTPAVNFGWILIGDESTGSTSKRFDSRTNPTTANRPLLTVEYTVSSAVSNWTIY